MKYKELKSLLKKTQLELFKAQDRIALRDKHIQELNEFSDMQERHQQMTEKALEKEWIIVSYLEDRQTKLIQAMAE